MDVKTQTTYYLMFGAFWGKCKSLSSNTLKTTTEIILSTPGWASGTWGRTTRPPRPRAPARRAGPPACARPAPLGWEGSLADAPVGKTWQNFCSVWLVFGCIRIDFYTQNENIVENISCQVLKQLSWRWQMVYKHDTIVYNLTRCPSVGWVMKVRITTSIACVPFSNSRSNSGYHKILRELR